MALAGVCHQRLSVSRQRPKVTNTAHAQVDANSGGRCAYQPPFILCPKPLPRAVSTALHRDEGAAHVSDGHRRAMPPNVGALPPTASSSVGRAALLAYQLTPRCWLRCCDLGNHGQEIWRYELAASRNARRCMKRFIFCLLKEFTYDQDFRVCAQHACRQSDPNYDIDSLLPVLVENA